MLSEIVKIFTDAVKGQYCRISRKKAGIFENIYLIYQLLGCTFEDVDGRMGEDERVIRE